MNGIKEVVFTLCVVCLVVGIFRMLLPTGGFGRVAAMVAGLFTLVCLLIPFAQTWDMDSLFHFSVEELEVSQELVTKNQREFEQAAVDEVTNVVLELSQKQGVEVKVTQVQTECSNHVVIIKTVVLVVEGSKQQAEQIKKKLLEVVKCEVSISWTKE